MTKFLSYISEMSKLVFRPTHSKEKAWHEECLKYGIYNDTDSNRYKQRRFSCRRLRKRVIFKQGDCNIVQGNVAKRRRRYLQDIFTTLVDAQWRWTLLIFVLSFLISWATFGIIWFIIAYKHGDIEYIRMTSSTIINENNDDPIQEIFNETFKVCITEIHSFTSAFLFSVETQHTIGFGNRYITEECPYAIFIMCLQCLTGVIIQAFMVGIVFAKLSRPKKRAQTLLFSRNAVICHRDGIPCLMFRVGDMRKSHILEAHVRAQIIRKKITKEGEELPFYQQELKVGSDGNEHRLLFIWPTIIVHKIDRHSPLYALSAQDMLKERFEIIVMLEGVVESTGMTTQARSSYLPSEILWGHRFESVVNFKKETGEYEVDHIKFNNTYEVDTPLCSSKQLDEVRAEINSPNGLERLCSAGLLPCVSSAASLDPASDDSIESVGRLKMHEISSTNNFKIRKGSVKYCNELNGMNLNEIRTEQFVFNKDNENFENNSVKNFVESSVMNSDSYQINNNSIRKISGIQSVSVQENSPLVDSFC
ncbi:G protein-activated inward rectifier potassium channel 3-like [Condylostylus longicornis]|uniref:G protein-activated inward rectifier potassium channel 3-like n=1 Tax=Condylostylus longicornis TaxID=2530218 RepID=UPI00244DF080|nr:G protein-activated inward rectifier potassium channel 3-like [Condylostylus longicornis]